MKACKNAKRYSGKQLPRCNGGLGCDACWEKYKAVLEARNDSLLVPMGRR